MPSCVVQYGVVIQVRTGSRRLPGKALLEVEGKPMLLRQVERLRAGLNGLPLVVATSDQGEDDPIEESCKTWRVPCFRGPLDDVLLRFILCARAYKFTHIIRVGGDDPLVDPNCCLSLVREHQEQAVDFLYASHRHGWPYGCAAELLSLKALEKARDTTQDKNHLEHTIPFFFEYPEEFSIKAIKAPAEILWPELALTVDFPEDLELIRKIFQALGPEGDLFPLSRVIRLLREKPGLREINRHLHKGFER